MPFNQICQIQTARRPNPSHTELVIEGFNGADEARPGQFAMLRPDPPGDMLLARPMSIHSIERLAGGGTQMRFWIKIVGHGTRVLAALERGQSLRVVGPFGRPFEWKGPEQPWLVAGGIGVTPLHFWARELCTSGVRPRFLYAARSSSDLVALDDLRRLNMELVVATDDGSTGERGFASEVLARRLESGARGPVFTCGPENMMKSVASVCRKHSLPCSASLETIMGCGFGVCLGCVVWRQASGQSEAQPVRVCTEGTLFSTEELGW